MLHTGLQNLDGFLSGGIPKGAITDVFGAYGTGKTQMLFQVSSNAVRKNYHVLYVDTSGSFRPERIIEFHRNDESAMDMLEKIDVLRVTNTAEQIKSLQIIRESDFDLILIDNVTDLFSYEYNYPEQMFEKNMLFMKYMHGLASHAIDQKISIMVTNTVRQIDDTEIENMHTAIDLFTHIKICLFRNGANLFGKASWLQHSLDFSYELNPDGLADVEAI